MRIGAKRMLAKVAAVAAASSAFVLALPTFAFAEAKEGIWVILPDMNEFIPMLIAFLVILFILGKFGWPVFNRILTKRADAVQEKLDAAEQARTESQKILEEYKAELADAKKQAQEIIAQAQHEGEAIKADLAAEAKTQAEDIIAKANAQVELERRNTMAELKDSAAALSIEVASRLIREDLSESEHRKVIERYVMEAGEFNAS